MDVGRFVGASLSNFRTAYLVKSMRCKGGHAFYAHQTNLCHCVNEKITLSYTFQNQHNHFTKKQRWAKKRAHPLL